jgi:hypothetical protein
MTQSPLRKTNVFDVTSALRREVKETQTSFEYSIPEVDVSYNTVSPAFARCPPHPDAEEEDDDENEPS